MAVLAIGRDDVVLVVQRVNRADRHGLLAGVEMAEAGDFAAAVHLGGLLFEAPDECHAPIEIEQLTLVQSQQRVLSSMFVAFECHGDRSNCNAIGSGGKRWSRLMQLNGDSTNVEKSPETRTNRAGLTLLPAGMSGGGLVTGPAC